jgi:hypothetical protein
LRAPDEEERIDALRFPKETPMQSIKTFRNLSFSILLVTAVVALQTDLFAYTPEQICDSYDNQGNGCSACEQEGTESVWYWEGTCDFEGATNPLEVGAEFCDDWYAACADTCGDAYANFLEEYYWDPWQWEASCFDTWETAWCEPGENTEQSCACNYFNWCAS